MREEGDDAVVRSPPPPRPRPRGAERRGFTPWGSKSGKAAVPALIERLQDEDEKVVRSAVISLGSIGDPRAVPALKLNA